MRISPKQQHIYDYCIDEQGKWICEGNPVDDPDLFRLLSRSLFEERGRYFIRCEGEIHPVKVADAPLWVRYVHVECDPQGNLRHVEIELHDGRREPLAAETLTVEKGEALYCLATHRGLRTRFGKVAYYELTKYLNMEEDSGRFFFAISGRRYFVRSMPESA